MAVGAAPDARAYRLAYPLGFDSLLVADARHRGLDPALVAALIRQESRFDPAAVSPAGAVGLMQVMPGVGRSIGRSLGYPLWDDALLREPDVSLELGTSHLASLLRRYDHLEHALAAYNAGHTRVRRWLTKGGTDDVEVFVERIPFVETRDYVRIVMRTRALYAALHNIGALDGRE
jgi:soluble lytic murein transglycosylase